MTVLTRGGEMGKQSQLSGLTGSAFAGLDGEVQDGKEKREGRALFAHTPLRRPAKLGGQAAGSERPLCFLPLHPGGTWLGGDLAKALVLSLTGAAELGQLVSSAGAVLASAAGRCTVHPCSAVRDKEKVFEWDGRVYGMGLRVCRAGFRAESHHLRWEVIFSLRGQHRKQYRAKRKGLLGGEGHPERGERSHAASLG